MLKKRNFWIGLMVVLAVGFLYGWLSIWATYTTLERQSKIHEADLQQIKHILFLNEDLDQQREEIIEWNRKSMISAPEWAVPEGDDNE